MSAPAFKNGDAVRVTRGKLAGWQGCYYEASPMLDFGWVAFREDPPKGAPPNLYNQTPPPQLNLQKLPRKLLAISQLEAI